MPNADPSSTDSPWTETAAAGVESAELSALLVAHWEHVMSTSPEWASQLGDHRFDDRLDETSWESVLARRRARDGFLARARAIDAAELSDRDRLTRALFVDLLAADAATDVCDDARWNLSAMDNALTRYNRLPLLVRIETPAHGRALVARYRAVPARIDDIIANLRMGAAAGRFTNATTAGRVLAMLRGQLAEDLAGWALLAPLAEAHPSWGETVLGSFRDELRAAVESGIRPAYARLADLIENEILPHARDDAHAGLSALPDGEACYAAQIRLHTTREASAREIHERGVAEIARIDGEIRALGARLFGTDDLAAVLARLREDRSLFFEREEDVEAAARSALAAAEARMGAFFHTLPRAPCVVVRVPDYEAPYTTIAYYREPHPDGSKPGEYFINVSEPATRPRFEMQVLAYHEAIPGHHLQIAIAQELAATPAFRKHNYLTAYAEGWALYTERLADEMGLYDGDLDRMGMLSYDAWRASRLVVDTGIHAFGWSRERAEAYMREHTALSPNNIANEVDRYISWPGQALAYKTGQLAIRDLRERAERALGDRFDLAAFHDAILTQGALTLPLLETEIARWVERR
jgi:uncharacterized protein (DUF885 family)